MDYVGYPAGRGGVLKMLTPKQALLVPLSARAPWTISL